MQQQQQHQNPPSYAQPAGQNYIQSTQYTPDQTYAMPVSQPYNPSHDASRHSNPIHAKSSNEQKL